MRIESGAEGVAPSRGEIRVEDGRYIASLNGMEVEIEASLGKQIAKYLRAQGRVDEDADTTGTRLTKKIADAMNCHLTASQILGLKGKESELRRGYPIADLVEKEITSENEQVLGTTYPTFEDLASQIDGRDTFPLVGFLSIHNIPVHSFIILGKSGNDYLTFEKVNKGMQNPWHLNTLRTYYESDNAAAAHGQFAVLSF